MLEKTSSSGSKAPTFKGKLLALDLDTSPVIGAMGLIPLLSKWRRLEIRDTATEPEEERKRERETKCGGQEEGVRQTVPKEREGVRTR